MEEDMEPRYVANKDISWEEYEAEWGRRAMVMVGDFLQPFVDVNVRLEQQAVDLADKPHIRFKDESYTFAEVNSRVNQVARGLLALGMTEDDGVAMFMKNKPEFLFTLYGCLKTYIPVSLLNTNVRKRSLLHCIKEGGANNLVVDDDPDLLSAVCEIREELRVMGVRVFVFGRRQFGFNSLSDVANDQSTDNLGIYKEDMQRDKADLYMFTSGTTGLPKAVRKKRAILGRCSAYFAFCNLRPDDILYTPLPLYHASSLLIFTCNALYAGLTVCYAEKFSARNFWKDCAKYGATVILYIGETCRYLIGQPPSPLDQQHNVRVAIGNGLRRDIWTEFKTRFHIDELCEFYGATEANTFLLNITGRAGAIGRRNPARNDIDGEHQIHLIDYDTENDVAIRGRDGLCRSADIDKPGLLVTEITEMFPFHGYSNGAQTEKKIIRNVRTEGDAYFNSGDLLSMDKDHYFYFVDRLGDTFRWKGENVSAQEVVGLICDLDIVTDCCVYGVSIPGKDGKCGMAAIVLAKGVKLNEDTLKTIHKQCLDYLPSYARPIFLRFMPELHLTVTYKHQKFKLQTEGYDIRLVSDVYMYDEKTKAYEPLTESRYQAIVTNSLKSHL